MGSGERLRKGAGASLVLTGGAAGGYPCLRAMRTERRCSWSESWRALWVRASLLVPLLAVLGAPLHLLSEPHAICAQHGEWVHVSECEGATNRLVRPADAPKGPVARGEERPDAHCPCELLQHHRELALVAEPASTAASAPLAFERALCDQSLGWIAFPRYLLAPSHSPPV